MLELLPHRILDVGGELALVVVAEQDLVELAVDRQRCPRAPEQLAEVVGEQIGLVLGDVRRKLVLAEQVCHERADDRPPPEEHPFLGEDRVAIPVTDAHDRLRRRQVLLDAVGVKAVVLARRGLEAAHVDGLAGAHLPTSTRAERSSAGVASAGWLGTCSKSTNWLRTSCSVAREPSGLPNG